MAPASASACVCPATHPATKLAQADVGIVGVVEARTGNEYTVRVERALKGVTAERVTLHSGFTSCQVSLGVGQRVGLVYNAGGEIFTCSYVDADELIAASELPKPSGSARYVAAVEGLRGVDAVQLRADGGVAGYGVPRGKIVAQGRCGDGVTEVVRVDADTVRVSSAELPLREVAAVGCTENGRRYWVVGSDGQQTQLITVFNGKAEVRMRRAADAATIAGARAYFVHGRLVRIVPFAGGKLRSARIKGEFASISGNGDRVAGVLRDGRSAVLNVRTGKLVTRRDGGRLTWLDDNRLLGEDGVYNAKLRRVRAVTTRGTLVGVVGGAAFFADGKQLLRLARGARRAVRFARLPGPVTAVTEAPSSRQLKFAWHSCEESANSLLTR